MWDVEFRATDLYVQLLKQKQKNIKRMSGVTQENEIQCDGSKAAVSLDIGNSTTQGSIIRKITAKKPVTPAPSYPVLAPVDCGLPITPPSCVLIMPSDKLISEGYDSDYQVGPFVERRVKEEKLVSMDEVPLKTPEGIAVTEEGRVELSPDTVLDDDTIKKMKISDLRVSPQARGMFRNGLQAVLINQLKTRVAKGVAILQDCSVAEI